MTHVHTIIFIPPGSTEPLQVKVYTSPNLAEVSPHGFFVTDAAMVVLSSYMYLQFRALAGDQVQQRMFVNRLPTITSEDIQKRIA